MEATNIRSTPVPHIACAPLTSKLTNTIFNSSGSATIGRDDPSTSTRTPARSGSSARRLAVLATRDATSTSWGRGCGGRAKTRRSLTRSLRPSMRATISFATAASRLSGGRRPPMTCTAPRIPASGFLTSCAMSAAISPRPARLACSRSCCSMRTRAVRSWTIPMNRRSSVVAISPTDSCRGNVEPSRRRPVTSRPRPMIF